MTVKQPIDLEDVSRLVDAMSRASRGSGEDSWFVVRPDIYAIPCGETYLLYSPLKGLVLLVKRAAMGNLLLNPVAPVVDCLRGCELEGDVHLLKEFDSRLSKAPARFAEGGWDFKPTQLMLSLTAACQLACDYCYIRGGDNPRNMPWEVVEAAVRLVANNVAERGDRSVKIQFHGQGEPTAAWRLFKDAIQFSEIQAKSRDLDVSFSIVSNGILTREKVEFIAQHNIDVGLSLDGLRESTDAQRPLRSGGSTYDRVIETMRMLREHGIPLAVRSTVTAQNVDEMKEFVRVMHDEAGCDSVHFEPMCGVGRAASREDESQSILPQFVKNFRDARREGLTLGSDVSYSTAQVGSIQTSFCGAYGTNLNFCVSTEGVVSSCYEVLEESDPRSELFVYGHYDRDRCAFVFDRERMERLVDLDVTKIGRCNDCFIKWNCGGDCISKAALGGVARVTGDQPLERCGPSREVAKDVMLEVIARGDRQDLVTIRKSSGGES
ncbi:MAG: radical SAM protein [Methylomicrobium sp.]